MDRTGSDLFVEALEEYGVTHLFGNPGTTELPVMEAMSHADVEYVLALHEDIAVAMAAGYARTRTWHANHEDGINPVGVVNLHVAPGLAHGLGNIFNATYFGNGAPIVVTAGAHATGHQHRDPILHGDLVEIADQFTKWSAEVKAVGALPGMLRRAFRVARTPPAGPVFLGLPMDVMTAETDDAPEALGSVPTAGRGDERQVAAAADRVVDADEPVLVVGDGIAREGREAVERTVRFAEASGARVVCEFKGKEISFPAGHDQWVTTLPDDREAATDLLDGDVIVFAGVISNVPTFGSELPDIPADADCIHVSESPGELGKNQRADVAVLGHVGDVLGQLADRVDCRVPESDLRDRLDSVARYVREYGPDHADAAADHPLASKAQLADAVAAAAPDALVVSESSTSDGVLRTRFQFEPERYYRQRGGGLGYGLPATVGTAIAEGERSNPRDVLGFVGDGAFLYYPQTLYTAARYDVDVTILVSDNRNYRILKDNMLDLFGGTDEDYDFVGMDFEPPVDIAGNAVTQGAAGRLVEDPDAIAPAIEEAIAESGPTVLDVLIHD